MKTKFQVALGVAVAVSAAAIGSSCSPANVGGAALELAPSDSIVYVSFSIEEGSDQEQTLEDLLDKFEKAPTLDEAKQQIGDAIFEAADLDITYDDDVQEWLGDEAALFIQSFSQDEAVGAGLIETTDQDATQEMIDEVDSQLGDDPEAKSYEGVDYNFYPDEETASGFVEDFWVVGTEEGFKAVVDTSEGEQSLMDSENFDSAVAELPEEHLGLFYFDYERLFEAMEDMPGTTEQDLQLFNTLGLEQLGGAAGVFYAQPNSAVFEFAAKQPENPALAGGLGIYGGSGLLPDMPGDSWTALGIEGLGDYLSSTLDVFAGLPGGGGLGFLEQQLTAETGLELRDLISWMGDAGAFVKGQSLFELQGGVVIESRDPAKSSEAIEKLGAYLRAQGAPVRPTEIEGLQGFAIQDEGMPQPVNFVAGDKVVIAYGDDATAQAIGVETPLSDSGGYREAAALLGEDFAPAFYMNFETLLVFVEAVGASASPEYEDDVKPWLDPLTDFIAGSKIEGDTVIQKLVIGVE